MNKFVTTFLLACLLCSALCSTLPAQDAQKPSWKLRECETISDVWNGNPTSFAFLARPDAMYIGFYSYDHVMTIGKRAYDSDGWVFKKLPSKIGWDSHNYITMTFDSDDCLHVSGNMHACPLIYFRATNPNDIESLEKVSSMIGTQEERCTYPSFMRDKNGRLIFTYRYGVSGNGVQFWNVYDEKTKKWTRLLDKPLFDGQDLMNAYFCGPTLGPDGNFHVAWVWRDTPDAATNHDLSYARSPDMLHWEKSNGESYELPITIDKGEIVDPVPAKGGILNSHVRMSFDQDKRVCLTYTKYDDKGCLQIWVARLEDDGWKRAQITNWDFVWNFGGGGSLPNEFELGAIKPASDDTLVVTWRQVLANKSGATYVDRKTLQPCDKPQASGSSRPEYSAEDAAALNAIASNDARLVRRSVSVDANGERWVFRWETLDANRDRPREDGAPKPTELRVFKFERNE